MDTRLGDEGDDDTRAGRRVIEGDVGLGHFDGTRAESAITIAKSKRRRNQIRAIFLERLDGRVRNGFRVGNWVGPTYRLRFRAWFIGRPFARFPTYGLYLMGCTFTSPFAPSPRIRFWNRAVQQPAFKVSHGLN